MPVLAFATADEWAAWLEAQPIGTFGLWVKFAKAGCKVPTISKPDAIDIALCHGWIDGQLKGFDENYFLTRFTPRKSGSLWSRYNRERALALIAQGRMQPAGQAEVEKARADGRWDTAYAPQSKAEMPEDLAAALSANPSAADFFERLSAANRYAILYRLHNAKNSATRARKLAEYVDMLARRETIHPKGQK